jgi:hypothetical protein
LITHGGPVYALGTTNGGYAIWRSGEVGGAPVRQFPGTDDGWRAAYQALMAWDPAAGPVAAVEVAPANPAAYPPVPYQAGYPGGYAPGYPAQQGYPAPYGYPAQQGYPAPYGYPAPAPRSGNSIGTAAGVVGIVGATLSLIPLLGILLGLVLGPVAIVLGAVGLGMGSSTGEGRGMATTGLVLGLLTVIFKLIPGVNLL